MTHAIPLSLIRTVFSSDNVPALLKGTSTHDAARDFVAQLVRHKASDDLIVRLVEAALPKNYSGNTMEEVPAMIAGARTKGFHTGGVPRRYEPSSVGPLPLGYTREGHFALLDQKRQIVVLQSSNQLLAAQNLMGLAPLEFWEENYPAKKLFNALGAGVALMNACRAAGPFIPNEVRGRGVWLEGGKVVLNFGEPLPAGLKHRYICFEPISIQRADAFETERLLAWLERFNWRSRQDARLLLGWLAIAPICGVLTWRPHCFIFGPPRCGKTTIHTLAARLLKPLVISTDGQSTEAGIRQTLGPDSLPIMIDEFESDQSGYGLRGVLRLARSASSADNPVLRGTPEGKAMQFSLRTTFFFGAINPRGMSAADESRILRLEMLMHDNDEHVARQLVAEEQHFAGRGPDWCGYMISHAGLIAPTIDAFGKAMPGIDRRHRQNITTLMAGAFVALHGRVPSSEEVLQWAEEFKTSIEVHAESLERDDASEALQHLLSYAVDGDTIGHHLAMELNEASSATNDPRSRNQPISSSVMRRFNMRIIKDGRRQGLYIRNQSPGVEKAFSNTRWADGAWMTALRKLDGATSDFGYFTSSGKHRALVLPLSYIGDERDPDPGF